MNYLQKSFGVIVFFFFVNQALAECSWVAWQKVEDTLPPKEAPWKIRKGFVSYEQCDIWKKNELKSIQTDMRPFKDSVTLSDDYVLLSKKESQGLRETRWYIQCFPDSIDPRG